MHASLWPWAAQGVKEPVLHPYRSMVLVSVKDSCFFWFLMVRLSSIQFKVHLLIILVSQFIWIVVQWRNDHELDKRFNEIGSALTATLRGFFQVVFDICPPVRQFEGFFPAKND